MPMFQRRQRGATMLALIVASLALAIGACGNDRAANRLAKHTPPHESPGTTTKAGVAYEGYVRAEVALLLPAARAFTDAVIAGDVAKARSLYAPARFHYESVEPVASSFGDLDPAIDNRAGDVEPGATWTGFHRLEKALWADTSLAGMTPIAVRLITDLTSLQTRVTRIVLTPAAIAAGGVELLQEIATSKITGEEDRYSHTDLSDFEANVIGAQEVFKDLRPMVKAKDTALAATISAAFSAVRTALTTYKSHGAFVDYSIVTQVQRKDLAHVLDGLAEPFSKVVALVA